MTEVQLFAPEVEEALLASMMQHRTAPLAAIELGLTRKDYGNERNAMIHDTMMRIVERGGSVNTTVVTAELDAANLLDVIGGKAPIERLGALPSDAGMVSSYVHMLKDRAARRGFQQSFERSMQILFTEPEWSSALAQIQKQVYREIDRHLSTTHSGVEATDLRTRYEGRGVQDFLPFASPKLTYVTGGGTPLGGLNLWGGHTNHGKSTQLVTEFIAHCRLGHSADFYALEMTEDQMVEKVLAQISGVHPRLIRSQADLSNAQKNSIDAAWVELTSWDAKLFTDPEVTVDDIRGMQMRQRRDRLFIDYLQRHDYSDYKELARFVKAYKNLALMTNCVIDLGSQVNPGEIRAGQMPFPIPNNNNLFGGKTLAFEADNVIFVWARQVPQGEGRWTRNGEGLYVVTKVRSGEAEHAIDTRWSRERICWEETDGSTEVA